VSRGLGSGVTFGSVLESVGGLDIGEAVAKIRQATQVGVPTN
jgi:hypothetical protein